MRFARRLASSGKSSLKSEFESSDAESCRFSRHGAGRGRLRDDENAAAAAAGDAAAGPVAGPRRREVKERRGRHAAAMVRVGGRCSCRGSMGRSNWLSGALRPAVELRGRCLQNSEICQAGASIFRARSSAAGLGLDGAWGLFSAFYLSGRRSDRQNILCGLRGAWHGAARKSSRTRIWILGPTAEPVRVSYNCCRSYFRGPARDFCCPVCNTRLL